MAFENSPSLDDFQNGIPKKLPGRSSRRNRVVILSVLLVFMLLVLLAVTILQSNNATMFAAKGSISGQAIDANGYPFHGDILIMGTDLKTSTQADGSFLIEGVPSGSRVLVLANDYSGYEFPVQVIAGDTVAIGQIQFMPTATP